MRPLEARPEIEFACWSAPVWPEPFSKKAHQLPHVCCALAGMPAARVGVGDVGGGEQAHDWASQRVGPTPAGPPLQLPDEPVRRGCCKAAEIVEQDAVRHKKRAQREAVRLEEQAGEFRRESPPTATPINLS